MDTTLKLTVNGREAVVPRGATVLQAAESAGVYIPTLCHHPALEPYGGCRMCIVEIEKMRGFPPSCSTPANEGMVVTTQSPQLYELRRGILELILSEHPNSCLTCWRRRRCRPSDVCLRNIAVTERCVICAKNYRCQLQTVTDYIDMKGQKIPLTYSYRNLPLETPDPFIDRDFNLCILCGRCVRVCQEVRCNGALAFVYRGSHALVGTAFGRPYKESGSEFCGACVDICPVGAIVERDNKFKAFPDREVTTTCAYCGVGCQLKLQVKDGKIIRVVPDPEGPANRGQACVKGKFGIIDFVHHPDRLSQPMARVTTPLVRQNGELKPATWEEALNAVAKGLRRYQPEQVAVFGAGKCTNEDNYVMQKLSRAVLMTNNVDHCARLCHAPTVSGLMQSLGSGAMTNPISDLEKAQLIFAIGTNTTCAHPVVGIKVKQATRQGRKLIVANPREIELCRYADLWLRNTPGSDVALLMGLMRVIVEEGLEDKEFIAGRCENYEALVASVKSYEPGFVEKVTGVAWEQIVQAARMYAKEKPASILYAMGITQSTHGTDNVLALSNLALLTGNIGKPGSGINPLRGHNNVQGACDMGALPDYLPGYQRVDNDEARGRFEQAWGVPLPAQSGLTITEIIHDAYQGKIKALYIMGENISLSEPCSRVCQGALEELEFLAVQDIFLTETAKLAHVVLPAASFAERDGTFTNTERRVQRVRQAINPVGQSRPDWWIICQIAQRLGGKGFDYERPSQIMEEVAKLVPSYAGISYERLEAGGLQWPCPNPTHPGTPILHTQSFIRGKGKFFPLEYRPPAEMPDEEYPLMLTTERSLFHFHTGTLTRKVKGLNELRGEELVEVHPQDARRLDIVDGEWVRVSSRRGEVEVKVKVTEASPRGVVCMTFHFSEVPTNILTNPAVDPVSKIPELKVCAVKIEKK
ncbi:MAG: formate dehydrogenase subunit alpha [Chloroflexota bacterium]